MKTYFESVSTIINLLKPPQTYLNCNSDSNEQDKNQENLSSSSKDKKLPFFFSSKPRYTSSCTRINLFHVMVFLQLVPTGGFEWSSI